jgi:hypothetical protein
LTPVLRFGFGLSFGLVFGLIAASLRSLHPTNDDSSERESGERCRETDRGEVAKGDLNAHEPQTKSVGTVKYSAVPFPS